LHPSRKGRCMHKRLHVSITPGVASLVCRVRWMRLLVASATMAIQGHGSQAGLPWRLLVVPLGCIRGVLVACGLALPVCLLIVLLLLCWH
jgi:hypothetical protein